MGREEDPALTGELFADGLRYRPESQNLYMTPDLLIRVVSYFMDLV